MMSGIYGGVYDLIESAIFGGSAEAAVYGVFFCEAIATVFCALLLAMPFLIVWRVIRRFL